MERDLMRQQMESIRAELNVLDSEREVLEDLLRGYESWFRLHPDSGVCLSRQLPFESISFKEGLLEVLRQARGQPLHAKEIWHRMSVLGVTSNARRPEGFVSMHANKIEGIEKVAPATFRLQIEERETQVVSESPLKGGEKPCGSIKLR